VLNIFKRVALRRELAIWAPAATDAPRQTIAILALSLDGSAWVELVGYTREGLAMVEAYVLFLII
jgi:hypothetical protein